MAIRIFHWRVSPSEGPKLNESWTSVGDGDTCRYTITQNKGNSLFVFLLICQLKLTVLPVVESANSWDYVRGSGYFEKVTIANGFRIRLRNCKQNEIQPVLYVVKLVDIISSL